MKTENDKRSNFPKILAIVVGVGVVLITSILLLVGTIMKNSKAYEVAIQSIEQNQTIIDETGGITGYGFLPMGSIEITNGFGLAELDIKVLGNEKNIKVEVALVKEPNRDWDLIGINKH